MSDCRLSIARQSSVVSEVAQGPQSGPAAFRTVWVLSTPQNGKLLAGLSGRPDPLVARPGRPNHVAVEEPQGWRASPALLPLVARRTAATKRVARTEGGSRMLRTGNFR